MTFAAEHRSAHFRLEGDLIVLPAVIADYLELCRCVFPGRRFFGAAFQAPLRGGHVSLVEGLLFLFGEEKGLLALNANGLDIWHARY